MVIKLSPPTQNEIDLYEGTKTDQLFSTDLNQEVDKQGTTPKMGSFVAEAEKLGVSRKETTRADAGLAGDFVKGFNEIILALPDAAINAIAEIGERLGVVPDKDIADRNYLNRIFNQGDYEKVKPLIPYILDIGVGEKGGMSSDSLLQKLFRSAGQGAGVAVPFTVGQQKLADQVLDTVPQIGQKLGQNIKEALLRHSKTAPALTAGAETIGGSLAAGGITAEKELVGTETGIGGLVAVAPFALYYGGSTIVNKAKQYSPIGWVAKNIGNFKDEIKGLKGAGVNQNLNTTAGKQVAGEIEKAVSKPEAVDNIEKSLDIEMRLQPYAKGPIKFSPAEQTLDAPLITTQKSAESTGDTDFTRKNFERKYNILNAVQNFARNEVVNSPLEDGPLFILNQATGKMTSLVSKLSKQDDRLVDRWEAITNADTGVFPKMQEKRSIGTNLQKRLDAAKTDAMDAANRLANKLGINDADPIADPNATVAIQNAIKSEIKVGEDSLSYQNLPPILKDFMERNFDDTTISFQDWKLYRDQVSGAIGRAKTSVDTRLLTIFAKKLDDLAENFGKTNEDFDLFRNYYNDNVVVPFQNGTVNKVIAKSPSPKEGDVYYTLAGENVAQAFIKDSASARQFKNVFGEDDVAMVDIKNAVLDDIRFTSGVYSPNKGTFDPTKIQKYINDKEEVLRELGLFDSVSDSANLINQLVQRQAQLVKRKKVIDSNLMLKAISRANDAQNPEKLIDEAMRNPALMRDLKSVVSKGSDEVSSEDALKAFRASVAGRLFRDSEDFKGSEGLVDPQKFKELLARNERVLDVAFDKSHVDNLYLIADATERVFAAGKLNPGEGINIQTTIAKFANLFGITPSMASNRFIALQEGRLGSRGVAAYFLQRAVQARQSAAVDAIFREMIFDPDLAKFLTNESTGVAPFGISQTNKRRLNNYLFTLGIDYGEGLSEDISGEAGSDTIVFEPNVPDDPIIDAPPKPQPQDQRQQRQQRQPIQIPIFPQSSNVDPASNPATVASLFPNDPTTQAILSRRPAAGGIGNLVV